MQHHAQQFARQTAPAITRQGGFTIVELVIVILIVSILSVGVINYIGNTVDGYTGAASRNQLASNGRTLIERLTAELQNALPNSIRTTVAAANGNQCIEFLPILAGTRYLNPPFDTAGNSFEVAPFFPLTPVGAHSVVIYPNNASAIYAGANPGPRAALASISGPDPDPDADDRITLTLAAAHRFDARSPVERVYLVDSPVSFCIDGGRLFRYANYGFLNPQPQPGAVGFPTMAPNRQLLADNIDNTLVSAFELLPPTLRRNALVKLTVFFSDRGDTLELNHEVLIRNVP